ncbi:MAG: hypothetical protein KatS3mg031_2605 [Chitinophagales bacterium]|nr:MAG: hypothetical protein KatS3mg031_2605 [Chitinophagales bacterium]
MHRYFAFVLILVALAACTSQQITYQDIEKQLQTQLILAADGDTLHLPEGYFKFSGSLSLDGKKSLVIRGAGMDKTVLSFKNQQEGSEGLKITNCENLRLYDFTIQDTKGDCIKIQKTKNLVIRNVKAEWTGKPKKTNGSYAFYPVDCDSVLIENCIAIGASDAGIYVGQSRDVIVRACEAFHNVAGIEIENCLRADVYNNLSHHNTGGILIFDMPELTQSGNGVRVFNNTVRKNNYRNFAPEGNIVHEVPPGTGIMVLATDNVEIFDNKVHDNKTIGTAIVSYLLVKKKHNDANFDPYPKKVFIYNNEYKNAWYRLPALSYDLGRLLWLRFPLKRPAIIYDGIKDPSATGPDGNYLEQYRICIRNNSNGTFANVDAGNGFKNISTNPAPFDCEHPKLQPVALPL